jgi:hypothetical protein
MRLWRAVVGLARHARCSLQIYVEIQMRHLANVDSPVNVNWSLEELP